MTRRDYIRITKALQVAKPSDPSEIAIWEDIVKEIGATLADENRNFRLDVFYLALGVNK